MGEYIDIDGMPTWTEIRGTGTAERTVVLLHGGLGNSDDLLETIGPDLEGAFRIVAFDRRGHGRTSDTGDPFHYDDMMRDAVAVIERCATTPVHLVGWSDGGIVALLVALRRPDLVDRLVLIGTNFHVDGVHQPDVADDSPVAAAMFAAYAERSPDGPDHFPIVARKFTTMISTEPELTVDDLAEVAVPTLVLVGDDDLVRLDHTVALYESLPAGQLCVIPGSSHAVVLEHPQLVAATITRFLQGPERPDTLVPIRRMHQGSGAQPTSK